MKKVRVTAADGTSVSGPARIQITGPQHLARTAVLGNRFERGGIFDLKAGQEVDFEKGEVFSAEGAQEVLDMKSVEPIGWTPEPPKKPSAKRSEAEAAR